MTPDQHAQTQLYEKSVFFAKQLLDFEPFSYQEKLLNDKLQRIIACMGRQTGKTSTIAARAIHYAYAHKKQQKPSKIYLHWKNQQAKEQATSN
jgi:phage FluMu gp28-like protein